MEKLDILKQRIELLKLIISLLANMTHIQMYLIR